MGRNNDTESCCSKYGNPDSSGMGNKCIRVTYCSLQRMSQISECVVSDSLV